MQLVQPSYSKESKLNKQSGFYIRDIKACKTQFYNTITKCFVNIKPKLRKRNRWSTNFARMSSARDVFLLKEKRATLKFKMEVSA
jgi:hypothetical protein